jgi:integrase
VKISATELRKWRDGLLAKGLKAPSVVRYSKALKAALNLAASHEARIKNKTAWEVGLETLPDATVARNVILDDRDVGRFIDAAYARDQRLGLLVEVLAVTGTRPSQATRLLVEDLHGGAKPRLSIPKSGKGGSKNRVARMHERVNVPISPTLTAKLKQAAKGRKPDAPLLLQSDGQSWGDRPSRAYRAPVAEIVQGLGLDAETTLYSLRHSFITRFLKRNVPIRIIAALCDTSIVEIERTYSKHIADHSDDISRASLRRSATTWSRSGADEGGARERPHRQGRLRKRWKFLPPFLFDRGVENSLRKFFRWPFNIFAQLMLDISNNIGNSHTIPNT